MDLTPAEFANYAPLAEDLDTPLIWLWNLPTNIAGPLASLDKLVHFIAVETHDAEHPTLAVLDRRDESLWVVGSAAGCRALAEALEPRVLWVEDSIWQARSVDSLRDSAVEISTAHHMRRRVTPAERSLSSSDYGPVRCDEMRELRASNALQYGSALDDVVDYAALIDAELIHAVRSGEALASTAMVGEPGTRFTTVSSVWTPPHRRRHGHASRLMRGILAWCGDRGRTCVLNVDTTNRAALALYQGLEFKTTKTLICAAFAH